MLLSKASALSMCCVDFVVSLGWDSSVLTMRYIFYSDPGWTMTCGPVLTCHSLSLTHHTTHHFPVFLHCPMQKVSTKKVDRMQSRYRNQTRMQVGFSELSVEVKCLIGVQDMF